MTANPILENRRNLILYLLSWLVFSAISFLLLISFSDVNSATAAADLMFNLLLCGLGIIIWFPARYLTIEDNSLTKIIVSHLLGGVLTSALWLLTGYLLLTNVLQPPGNFVTFFRASLVWKFLIGFLFYLLAVSLYYMYNYYRDIQERITKEAELKNLIMEAELKTLKFQINPHFIFNSLNSMSALTVIDPERAREMILKLADFLRYTLANNEKQTAPLCDELRNIKLYLEIEKVRFEDKFEYIEKVSDDCKNLSIPNMILQPIFENAIKHAVYESLEKVTIKLTCSKEDLFFRITLENNYDPTVAASKGTGIGLQNIKNRLELMYHRPDLLEVKKEADLFKVNLFIPW